MAGLALWLVSFFVVFVGGFGVSGVCRWFCLSWFTMLGFLTFRCGVLCCSFVSLVGYFGVGGELGGG